MNPLPKAGRFISAAVDKFKPAKKKEDAPVSEAAAAALSASAESLHSRKSSLSEKVATDLSGKDKDYKNIIEKDKAFSNRNREQVETLMKGCPPGMSTLRPSTQGANTYALSYISYDKVLKHELVSFDENGLFFPRSEERIYYTNPRELMDSRVLPIIKRCELKELIENNGFRQPYTREDSERIMRDLPVGTCVIRISSQGPDIYSLTYVGNDKTLKHELITFDEHGFYFEKSQHRIYFQTPQELINHRIPQYL